MVLHTTLQLRNALGQPYRYRMQSRTGNTSVAHRAYQVAETLTPCAARLDIAAYQAAKQFIRPIQALRKDRPEHACCIPGQWDLEYAYVTFVVIA
jgi:hypothetical protein